MRVLSCGKDNCALTFRTQPTASLCTVIPISVGSGGREVERRTVNRGDAGSNPHTAVSKLRQFRSPHIWLSVSEGTIKAGGPFYLVSMSREVKYLTQCRKCVTCSVNLQCNSRKGPTHVLALVWAVWRKPPEN